MEGRLCFRSVFIGFADFFKLWLPCANESICCQCTKPERRIYKRSSAGEK